MRLDAIVGYLFEHEKVRVNAELEKMKRSLKKVEYGKMKEMVPNEHFGGN